MRREIPVQESIHTLNTAHWFQVVTPFELPFRPALPTRSPNDKTLSIRTSTPTLPCSGDKKGVPFDYSGGEGVALTMSSSSSMSEYGSSLSSGLILLFHTATFDQSTPTQTPCATPPPADLRAHEPETGARCVGVRTAKHE